VLGPEWVLEHFPAPAPPWWARVEPDAG
jgi:hypothetical protein